jgi:hypothetical protein
MVEKDGIFFGRESESLSLYLFIKDVLDAKSSKDKMSIEISKSIK